MDIPPASKSNVWRNMRAIDAPMVFTNSPILKTAEGAGLSVGADNLVFASNPKGTLTMLPLGELRKVEQQKRIMAHPDGVVDIQHSPMHHDLVASSGVAGDVHVAKIFVKGSPGNTNDSEGIETAWHNTQAHSKKCLSLSWNPIADHVLASAGHDSKVKVWDLQTGKKNISLESEASFWQIQFLQDGKLVAGMGQDNVCRIYDVRSNSLAAKTTSPIFASAKPAQCTVVASENGVDPNLVVAVGFENMGKRFLKTFDVRDLSKPIMSTVFPGAAAQTYFTWMPGQNILFIASKGDSKVVPLAVEGSQVTILPEANFPKPCGSVAFLPPSCVDVMHTEIARCYRTELESKSIIQSSFHCGKKDDLDFQPQYYGRGCISYEEPIPADYWFEGGNSVPRLVPYQAKEGCQIPLKPSPTTVVLRWSDLSAASIDLTEHAGEGTPAIPRKSSLSFDSVRAAEIIPKAAVEPAKVASSVPKPAQVTSPQTSSPVTPPAGPSSGKRLEQSSPPHIEPMLATQTSSPKAIGSDSTPILGEPEQAQASEEVSGAASAGLKVESTFATTTVVTQNGDEDKSDERKTACARCFGCL